MSVFKSKFNSHFLLGLLTVSGLGIAAPAYGQGIALTTSPDKLQLAPDSPFRDPDVIYLEADELENDEKNKIIYARGSVEGRYQDKTILADQVRYDVTTGQVFAIGNVVLINADGSSQYADKLELSDELEAGTATNFLARFPKGGQLASAFAARKTDTGIELYNAYYTACEACKVDGKTKKPTWRLKARKVTQDKDSRSIRYRDAVFEFKGIPVFYSPYLAHPDPTVDRASGLLIPFVGVSASKGFNFRAPYYFALSDYSELTVTPRIFAKVNPVLAAKYRRQFFSGEFNFEGSFTNASFFDNRGDVLSDLDFFRDPEESLKGKRWRSHFFSNGLFNLSKQWKWGFEAGYATDDNYLDRYDFDEQRPDFGLYKADSRRLMQQLFVTGQSDSFRFSTSAFGNISLRTRIRRNQFDTNPADDNPNELLVSRENDSILPVIAPKIELSKYFKDPVIGGRLKLSGDLTVLTRALGTDYTRATAGLDWQKTWVAPTGIEVKPFAMGRFDYFNLEAEDEDLTLIQQEAFNFNRSLGQVGVDIRWPFLKAGAAKGDINWVIEPRVQITQSFGDGKLNNFLLTDTNNNTVSLFQDSLDVDLDQALIWNPNKATGFDLWQKGFRADYGASLIADWGDFSRAHLFIGQSYHGNNGIAAFSNISGLSGNRSDVVGQLEVNLGKRFSTSTRIRYNTANDAFRRLDTSFRYRGNRIGANARYYRLDSQTALSLPTDIPSEEISGSLSVKLIDNWSTKYTMFRDLDKEITRRQNLSLVYDDNCTRIEFIYTKQENDLGLVRRSDGFGIRVSLLTLGDFSPE
ncbi:MAG: LPS assembly protein LptD [Robiginitomaculum sp.]|nr:LPS assembly protein LptD [Robiginitomaculum sp.]